MTIIEDISYTIYQVLTGDTTLTAFYNNKLAVRYKRAVGDEPFGYIVYDIIDKGPTMDSPICDGTLIIDIWHFADESRTPERIKQRLKHLFHRTILTGDTCKYCRTWWLGSINFPNSNAKVQHTRCTFQMRYYDMELHEAELT